LLRPPWLREEQIRDYRQSQVGVDVVQESAEDVLKVVPVELVHTSHGLTPSRLSDGAVAIREACNIHRFDFTAGDTSFAIRLLAPLTAWKPTNSTTMLTR
jgi:hypothetical protein